MKTLNAIHTGSKIRQQDIITAALTCFTEKGFAAASIADICQKAKASTGSVYHHFKSKSGIAAAVYLAGIRDYQDELLSALENQTDPKKGIFKIVSCHLAWVKAHPDWARFLFQHRYAMFMQESLDEMEAMNHRFATEVERWFRRQKGHFKALPRDVFISLLLGPCQEFSRFYLAGTAVSDMDQAASSIAGGVWEALSFKDDPPS